MKKIVLTMFTISALALQVQAQKWVKTTPQNKNVILEEFTGIHCGYCPDGHRIANQMVAANPGRVFLINIHSGNFAVPATGEPDLRTDAGNTIDASSGITGYPSGSVNRATSPWGQGRNLWVSQASAVLAQTSPVNVEVRSSINWQTYTMTTEVEVYYTSNAAQTKNYLTVALTEDEIIGVQSDYGNYNPTNWVGGKYRHNHVLRQMITPGTWGIALDTTTKDKYYYKKFVTQIPGDYKGVDVAFYNLNVVAYVTEASNGAKIVSGNETKVDFDQNIKTDLSIKDLTTYPTSLCVSTLNPQIEVTNNLDQVVSSFDVNLMLNGMPVTKSFSGTLNKGEKTTIDWGSIPFSATGAYTMSFTGFADINAGTLFDVVNSNNSTALFSSIGFKSKAFTTFTSGFDAGMPANVAFDQSQNTAFKIITGTTIKYGNFATASSVLFYLHSSWNVAGKPASIMLGEADFTGYTTDPGLGYYYAYSDGGQGGTAPTVDVNVSQDCGATWTKVSGLTAYETGQPSVAGNILDPKIFTYVKTPLTNYKGKSVLVKITVTPGSGGNALFIDNINLNTATKLAVADDVKTAANVVLSPNPVNNAATLNYDIIKSGDVTFTVYNVLNQLVYSKTVNSQASGNYAESFDFSNFNAGVYTLTISTPDGVTTKKFVKN